MGTFFAQGIYWCLWRLAFVSIFVLYSQADGRSAPGCFRISKVFHENLGLDVRYSCTHAVRRIICKTRGSVRYVTLRDVLLAREKENVS